MTFRFDNCTDGKYAMPQTEDDSFSDCNFEWFKENAKIYGKHLPDGLLDSIIYDLWLIAIIDIYQVRVWGALERLGNASISSIWNAFSSISDPKKYSECCLSIIAPLAFPDAQEREASNNIADQYLYSEIAHVARQLHKLLDIAVDISLVNEDFPDSDFDRIYDSGLQKRLLDLSATVTACEWPKLPYDSIEQEKMKDEESVYVVRKRRAGDDGQIWTINGEQYSEIGKIYRSKSWDGPECQLADGGEPAQRLYILDNHSHTPPKFEPPRGFSRHKRINFKQGTKPSFNYIRHVKARLKACDCETILKLDHYACLLEELYDEYHEKSSIKRALS